uniref:Uncharacterized protein n=1 Tax=Arundo donax TaxID=35708 RepID=A0A0A9C3F2_ARUDO
MLHYYEMPSNLKSQCKAKVTVLM